ncbi:MAG: serine hydroxymethyltransferase, partial [Streptococcus sp.]|nr:serine hydroxymethyltransferase [Streptococcus sp.]
CFAEAATPAYKSYAKQVIKNAQCLANELTKKGYRIVSGGTDNHCFLVDLTPKKITGLEAQEKLESIGITVNKNLLPFDEQSSTVTSGIRLGTAAVTSRGYKEKDMKQIATWIDQALTTEEKLLIGILKREIETYIKTY